jgi:fimbrial chaperone protein
MRILGMTRFQAVGIALAAVIVPTAAYPAAVVLWPVDPIIASNQQSAAVWIENRGSEPVTMQVRSLGWSQANGEDSYVQQDAVVSSPPVAQVAPGARQLVRIIRRTADPSGEHAYRLLIDELPRPADSVTGPTTASLAVQMRYSIPLFTYGAGEQTQPRLSIRIELDRSERYLEVHNSGGRHARLTDLRLVNHGQTSMLISGLAGYVLPGATKRFKLPANSPLGGSLVVGVNGADQTLSSLT